MSEIKKRLTVICTAAALCASMASVVPVMAADTESQTVTTASDNQPKYFTIDDAIQYAKENSRSIASCQASENKAKYSIQDARYSYKDMRKVSVSDISTYLIASGYYYRAAWMSYRVAQRSTIMQENMIESNVTSAFYTYLGNVNKEKIAADSLESAHNRTAAAEIRYQNGMISANDLESFKIAETEAQYNLNSATRTKDYSMLQLKSAMSYPLDSELIVSGQFERVSMDSTTPEAALAKAQNSLSHANIEDSIELSRDLVSKYHSYYSPNQASYYTSEAEYENAELDYQTSIDNERLNIYNTYNSLVSTYEQLDLCDKNLALLNGSVEAVTINYESGMVDTDTYISTLQKRDSMKATVADAELGAYLLNVQYKMLYDWTNTIFKGDESI